MRRYICLLSMGGTIASDASDGPARPAIGANELVTAIGSDHPIEVRVRDVARTSSRSMTPADMWRLAAIIREEVDRGAAGIVVTHGTDTLEETAYALALQNTMTVPIILTGSMRSANAIGSDGPANLAAAVCVAAEPNTAAYGPLVVHQDEIHTARWATKMFSTRVAAFASPAAGPVGLVVEGQPILLLGPPPGEDKLPATDIPMPTSRVELIWAAAGMDGLLVDSIADSVDGLVVAGTGGGHVHPALAEALLRAVAVGRPVVLASRCGAGQVLRETYGGVGSETHLLSGGLIAAGSLAPLKARLRLIFGLSAGMRVSDLFARECAR